MRITAWIDTSKVRQDHIVRTACFRGISRTGVDG